MTILKSKAFWGFTVISGGFGSAVAYDRFEAKKIHDEFMREAAVFGEEPLYPDQSPRCLSFFLISPTAEHRRACTVVLKRYALDILTAAGVDYKWTLLIDAEEGKEKWDIAAREANQPELMMEDTLSLKVEHIVKHLLRPVLNPSDLDTDTETKNHPSWTALREKYASVPCGKGSEGFVCFDSNTREHLQSELVRFKDVKPVSIVNNDNNKKSWWRRSSTIPSSSSSSSSSTSSLFPVNLYFFPCELSQSPLARLQRFLFGQRDLTRRIGESVLKCIKEQPFENISNK